MASWESRFWPVRRWLADRLVGDHAYSKNLAPRQIDTVASWWNCRSTYSFPPLEKRWAVVYHRNPQEKPHD